MTIYEVNKTSIEGEWTEEQSATNVPVTYQVITSNNANADDIITLIRSGSQSPPNGLPSPWVYDANTGMRVASIKIGKPEMIRNYQGIGVSGYSGINDVLQWTITATYTDRPRTNSGGQHNPATATLSPDQRSPNISWGGSDSTEQVLVDLSGNPLTNSMAQPIEGVEREAGGAVVTITRNEMSNGAANWNAYSHSTNSATWYGMGAGTCKMGRITATKKYETVAQSGSQISYWEVSYPIAFKSTGWKLYCYDYTDFIYDSNGKPIKKLDANGQPIRIKLNGSGAPLSDQTAAPVVYPANGYTLYAAANWSTLGLPNPFA